MNTNQQVWESCTIESQVLDDGREPGQGGQKLMWLQFRARLDGRKKIISRSEKIPLENMVGANSYGAQKSNVGHQNTLNNFLQKLQADGWELQPLAGADWWQRRLRRVKTEDSSKSLLKKIRESILPSES